MKDPYIEAREILVTEARRLGGILQQERGRKRAPVVRRLHEIRQMLDRDYRYESQAGQDLVVDQLLKQKRRGIFLDVGAYDGLKGSNSYFLETIRGWSGLLVEPVAANITKLKKVRNTPYLQVAVGARDGEADFIEVTQGYRQMSGLRETYDPEMLETVRANQHHQEKIVKVPVRTLPDIIQDEMAGVPDFVSLDIEGTEMSVLESFPFREFKVQIWAIENNDGTPEIARLMRDNGYDLIEYCGPDEVYTLAAA